MPLQPLPRPQTLVSDGTRLDGRGMEEFRPVCEWLPTPSFKGLAAARAVEFGLPVIACALRPWVRCAPTRPPAGPPAVLETKVVSRAAGSAYAEFGSTKVMVAM